MEDYRNAFQQVEDWILDYWANSERYPVLSKVRPGEVRRALPQRPPQSPEDFSQIMDDFRNIILPGVTHWNHPGFFAYFAITGSPPGILGDMLSTALNVNAMLWKTCPAATELEI